MKWNTKSFADVNVTNRWRVADDTVCNKRSAIAVLGIWLRHGRPARLNNPVHHGSFLWKGSGMPSFSPDRSSCLDPECGD